MTNERILDNTHEKLQAIGLSDPRLTVAATAALLGAREVLAIYGASPDVLQTDFKASEGQTPRTVADLRSGAAIKGLVRAQFPNARINEEETGDEKALKGDQDAWHVDPLDGTSSFAEGQRYSTVGIALYRSGLPFASVVVNPFERELLVAQTGKGAFVFDLDTTLSVDGTAKQAEVSRATTLAGGVAFIDALFNGNTMGPKLRMIEGLARLADNNLGIRMTGSNIGQEMSVALGRGRLTLTDAVGGFFDLAAGGLAIIEAGGKFTDQNGKQVDEKTQLAIGTNGPIHDDVLELAQRCYINYRGFK